MLILVAPAALQLLDLPNWISSARIDGKSSKDIGLSPGAGKLACISVRDVGTPASISEKCCLHLSPRGGK